MCTIDPIGWRTSSTTSITSTEVTRLWSVGHTQTGQKLSDTKNILGEYANIEQDASGNPSVDWNAPRPMYPWWTGAVSEAVFAIGAERNGDVVIGASYAPLLCNLNSYQWTPDLIGTIQQLL